MSDTNRAERLLSLFTSPDRAAAIAGDLTEEREHRGWIWFWLHVLRTTLALWRSAVTDGPLRVLVLAVAGCALFAAPALAGAAAVSLFPQHIGSPVSWLALLCFWCGGALGIGAALVGIAPRRGMAACAALALAGEAVLIALGVAILWRDAWTPHMVLFYATGLIVAVPLLLGGAVARRRMIACGVPTVERHR